MPQDWRMDEQADGDEAAADGAWSDAMRCDAIDWRAARQSARASRYGRIPSCHGQSAALRRQHRPALQAGRLVGWRGPRPSGGQWQWQRPWRGHGHVASCMAGCCNGCHGGAVHMRLRGHGLWMGMGIGAWRSGCLGAWGGVGSCH